MEKYLLIPALFFAAFTANAQQTQRTPSGATYTLFTNNPGPKAKLDDVITFNIVQSTDKDSVLFSTYKAGHTVQTKIQASQNASDLMDVFTLLAVNDSILVKTPVDTIFKGHEAEMPPFFKKGGYLVTTIKMVKIQSLTEAMAERQAEMDKIKAAEATDAAKYIADNKLNVITTASGLKYLVTSPSTKRKPVNGDTVLVNYKGYTLDGEVFDTSIAEEALKGGLNQPGRNYAPYPVVLGEHGVIPAWEEAIALLGEGAKAKLIIPSSLAYGDRGSGKIKPFSTLVFDIELVKVTQKRVTPAAKAKAGVKKPLAKKKPAAKKTVAGKKKN